MENAGNFIKAFLTKLAAVSKRDGGKGNDGAGVTNLVKVFDQIIRKVEWFVDKAVFPEAVRAEAEKAMRAGMSVREAVREFGGQYLGRVAIDGNLLLNEGINELWTLVAGGGGTAFSNANSYLGVGDDNTAADAAQTGLQAATNKLYKAMDGGFPTYGTSQKITARATFGPGDANFAWNEFTLANGNSDAAKNLNRKVSAQGTKASGQTWQLSLEITLS